MAASRTFTVALVVSTLFHLSMVSVFSIVIRFPNSPTPYCTIDIVHQAAPSRADDRERDVLRTTSPERLIETSEAELYGPELPDALPEIELPRLEIASAEPFSNREESEKIRSRFGEIFEQRTPEPEDSWAMFTRELRGIGPTLSRLTLPRDSAPPRPERVPIARTGTGVDVSVEWMSAPRDRKALYSPPMGALWNVDAAQLQAGPIMLVFTVSPEGKVTDVQSSVEDDAGVIAGVKKGLKRFLFEPLIGQESRDQRGTLYVTPEPGNE